MRLDRVRQLRPCDGTRSRGENPTIYRYVTMRVRISVAVTLVALALGRWACSGDPETGRLITGFAGNFFILCVAALLIWRIMSSDPAPSQRKRTLPHIPQLPLKEERTEPPQVERRYIRVTVPSDLAHPTLRRPGDFERPFRDKIEYRETEDFNMVRSDTEPQDGICPDTQEYAARKRDQSLRRTRQKKAKKRLRKNN